MIIDFMMCDNYYARKQKAAYFFTYVTSRIITTSALLCGGEEIGTPQKSENTYCTVTQ
jgi:hypothetical protein